MHSKTKNGDVDDAVMNSIYDDKYKKSKAKKELNKAIQNASELKGFLLREDPKLLSYLDLFRCCQDFLENICKRD